MTGNKQQVFNPIALLRYSIGIIYFWFGALKFFYGLSPAEQIASQTIHKLTFGLLSDHAAINLLAIWECSLGILLILRRWMKTSLTLLFIHMPLTFTPFLFFPHETFLHMPYDFTLLGQYIMKNLIILSGAWVLWQQYVKPAPPVYVTLLNEQQ
ncbi:hypothetical protein ACI6Q2_13950 [Chitinophagaceae bacterium LWZ2-11]